MNNMKKIVSVTVSGFIILFLLLLVFMPKESFSEKENRYLQEFPSFNFADVASGDYMSDLSSWFNDCFPFRDTFVGLKTAFEKNILRKKEINGVYISADGYMIEKYEPISDTDRIANVFDKFCRNVQGTRVNIMLVPTAFEVMSDKLPKYTATDEQSADMQKIFDGITAENAVKINPTSALESAGNRIYYKLDHHWTSEGAYIGYRELCKSIGVKPSPLAGFNKKVVTTDFYGTVYSKLNDYSVEGDTITAYSKDWNLTFKTEKTETNTIFNPEYLYKKDKYSYFLDNVHSYIEIENKDAKEEKSAVIIKDSYANCMIPFMIDDYSKIYIFDTRYYRESVSDFVNENHPTDVFVVYNMNTIGTDNGVNGIR